MVDLHKDRVFSTCMSFLPNTHDAEDLTQEVFIEIYHSVSHFKENAKLSTWMYRIAVNKCLEELRKTQAVEAGPLFLKG